MPTWPTVAAVLAALLGGAVAAALLHGRIDGGVAETARGTEPAFASGLHPREMPPGQPPIRWTGPEAKFVFPGLGRDAVHVAVAVRGHRTPVTVSVDGVVAGTVPVGGTALATVAPPGRGHSRVVTLSTDGFEPADGRHLGAMLDRVSVNRADAARVDPRTLALLALPAAAVTGAAVLASVPALPALLLGIGAALLECALLSRGGLLYSGAAAVLAAELVGGALLSLGFALWCDRKRRGAAPWAYAALAAAITVQGIAATHPAMVVSDAVFHANKLSAVAAGDLFPTSVTQHARPFRFPYGVSFYALLAPLRVAGVDPVLLVRGGAAVASVLASAALFAALASRGPALAGVAVGLLQLLPVTFDVFSYGNLSNVFAQAVTVMFFAWWAGAAPGGWLAGAVLFVVAALGHFSGLIVLVTLVAALGLFERRTLRADRARGLALGAGLAGAGLYYVQFVPLVLAQLPRLLEGGGQGSTGGGALRILTAQLARAAVELGVPALVLAALAWYPRAADDRLERALRAFWAAGGVLLLFAALSPLDVRWIYAMSLTVAAFAAFGAGRLWTHRAGRPVAVVLLLAQAVIGARGIVIGLFERYR